MQLKALTTLALILFVIPFTFGQANARNFTVKGSIVDEQTGQPLEFATVSFFNAANDLVAGGITEIDGKYSISVPEGVYTVQYDYISYKTVRKENVLVNKTTELPPVRMALDAASLEEVVVTAETTEVVVRLDKKIYNIGKDLTTSGATVSDALNNVPSVTVDVDGAINLRGNGNVQILINGRPSALAGFGNTDALRQLPAETIERVEVITSPSARYDAEGSAGIINIVLKKDKNLGFNGSIISNLGFPWGASLTGNINYRQKKFNIFNTTSVRYQESPGNGFFRNDFNIDGIENPTVIEDRDIDRIRRGITTNLGITYNLTDRSTITASGFYRTGNDDDRTGNFTDEFDTSNALAEQTVRIENENEVGDSYQVALNYTNNFNDEGHNLAVDLQYDTRNEEESNFIEERAAFPVAETLPAEDITTDESRDNYLIQADYVLPIGENAQFEAGYRGQFRETVTDFQVLEEVGTSGVFERNGNLSNVFTFQQDVNAIYTQYGNKFGKFSFLLGLRYESTRQQGAVSDFDPTVGDDFDVDFDETFDGLFPTVNLIYELGESENITFGYNRRINRPRGFFVNPFPSRSSEANIFQGNPGLNPAFASAFDLGYLKRWEKLTLTSSVYYQYESDAFQFIRENTGDVTPNGVPVVRTIPINLATNERFGAEAGVLYNPTKWLRLNGSFNFFRFVTEGDFNGTDFSADNTSWFARFSSKVTLPAKIDWQTNAFYRGPREDAQTKNKGILSIDLAFAKDLFNDNATLGFNVRDLFNSRKRISETNTPNFTQESEFQWRERQFTMSFTYRFNQQKRRQQRGRQGGGDDDFEFQGRP
ncbi:TonB-dependent receptor domain-containing protein [Gilvibacter sp.]|uniref:TonB-dependent receptor domain-containing protein n=1 Tax=Gilvibacter sp. TaxID=2729997 RepID=UPI003F4A7AFB